MQQVFAYVHEYNVRTGRKVRCYVPTHSLLNYASWHIVSPESSLARIEGCDGYIAQVWTGTSRTPNTYRGKVAERTFETAFLEYGSMQNLVRSTGRSIWYLNDPIEDNPDHDWEDYRINWESTLTASLLQPEVAQFEVAPWPERIFGGKYPRKAPDKKGMPPQYATELQTVINALNDLKHDRVEWDAGTDGIGVLISDSLMFERGASSPSDERLGGVYGLALPLLKRGMPVAPVQLENAVIPGYLDRSKVLLMSYHGMKPLSPEVHTALASWVKRGGALIFCDDDGDPFNKVRDWWNSNGQTYGTPREQLFEALGWKPEATRESDVPEFHPVGKGSVVWIRTNPAVLANRGDGDQPIIASVKTAAAHAGLKWRETNYLLLRRGPYVIAAGLDESIGGDPRVLKGRWVNLFDPQLRVQTEITLTPRSRYFLLDLDLVPKRDGTLLASACKTLADPGGKNSWVSEGVEGTPSVALLVAKRAPRSIKLDGQPVETFEYSPREHLLWVRFENQAKPRHWNVE